MLPGQWYFKNSLTLLILALLVIACLQTLILVESLFTEKKRELTSLTNSVTVCSVMIFHFSNQSVSGKWSFSTKLGLNQDFLKEVINAKMWSPWKVALFLLSLPTHESAAYFLDSNDYYLIQNAFREHFVPTLWCGVRNAAPYSNPSWYF